MFYTFRQNNSGGSFTEPAINVIVEASNESEAIARAEEKGLYWDGVDAGNDCECCGDRWSPYTGGGEVEPTIYGKPASEYKDEWGFAKADRIPTVAIFYMDGREEKF